MSESNFFKHRWDFVDQRVFTTTVGDNAPFLIKDTSAGGTPTYAVQSGGERPGELLIKHSNNNEIQNVCLYQNDLLIWDIDLIDVVRFGLKLDQATFDATSQLAFGLAGARNDAIDSIAQHALFRLIGSTSLVVETDDGTTDKDDIATNKTIGNTYAKQDYMIGFAQGKKDVRFFADGDPVALSEKFDMSAYSGGLQLFLQLQKTANTNTDGVRLDYIEISGRRS